MGRRGFARWTALIFLVVFVVLIIVIFRTYLAPAMVVAKDAPPARKEALEGWSALLLMIVMVILVMGLLLTLRLGRFFAPRPRNEGPTKVVDAWSEAGKRLKPPPPPQSPQE